MAMRRRSFKRAAFRRPFGNVKRKTFAFEYVTTNDTALVRGGGANDQLVIFEPADWQTSGGLESVKGVSLDLAIAVTWSPEVTTVAYDSWQVVAAVGVFDDDEAAVSLLTVSAEKRWLWWGAQGRNTGEQPTANGAGTDSRAINWRCRARQRFLKPDEELRLCVGFTSDVTATIADARLQLFGRISWEIP